ncbi:hypothetical protein D9M71_511620 [compost metagenome]
MSLPLRKVNNSSDSESARAFWEAMENLLGQAIGKTICKVIDLLAPGFRLGMQYRGLLVRSLQPQPFGQAAEIGAVQAQLASGTGPVVLVATQAGLDHLPLVVVGRLAQIAGGHRQAGIGL